MSKLPPVLACWLAAVTEQAFADVLEDKRTGTITVLACLAERFVKECLSAKQARTVILPVLQHISM